MIHFDVTLVVEGPFLTKDSTASVLGADAASLRGRGNRFQIPDTLIKGRLNDAWLDIEEQLALADVNLRTSAMARVRIDRDGFLGVGADESKKRQLTPGHGQRGRLIFSDLTASGSAEYSRQTRVKIEALRLSADEQMLVELDAAGAPGERITFAGTLDADLPEDQAENARSAVEAGLRWITAIGGLTGAGFGTVLDARVTRSVASKSGHIPIAVGDHLDLALSADRAICVMGHTPVHQNIFESLEHIPGNVLKGALASSALRHAGLHGHTILTEQVLLSHGTTDQSLLMLARHFGSIRIRHAFPGPIDGVRPRVIPLSLFRADTYTGVPPLDAALLNGPTLIDGLAPAFSPDWKDSDNEKAHLGWFRSMSNPPGASPVSRRLRIRTAITRATRRATDKALFAHERVDLADGYAWRTEIDMLGVGDPAERQHVISAIASLLADGIGPVGKSKAFLRASEHQSTPTPTVDSLREIHGPIDSAGRFMFLVVLQSEALLGSPETFARRGAFAMYEEAFSALSNSLLDLRRVFAQQQLAGGSWLHDKFRRPRGLPYSPYLLSRSGSVFVLEMSTAQPTAIFDLIDRWRSSGLPLDSAAREFYAIDSTDEPWSQCPFLPENGYGEVAINQQLHLDWQPHHHASLTLSSAEAV